MIFYLDILVKIEMTQYKTIVIYVVFNSQSKKAFEEELEKYGLERLGEQDIFALPLRRIPHEGTSIQSLPASLFAQASGQSGTQYCSWSHA